ncbi:MAG: hypothetical protein KAH54_04450 [Candidatus Sabulitectum sp.]|nr:hypothetical protein [Candidatus Sabulitectum sp.]
MSYHTQRPAKKRTVLALALQETIFVVAWGALGGALLLPFTEIWIYATIPAALIAIHFLVSMEISGDGSPLVSLEIKQQTFQGKKITSRWVVYSRIVLTTVLFPAALIGYISLLFGKPSIPEIFTGIRLTATDRRFDPRATSAINGMIRKAMIRMRMLSYVPLAAAAAVFILFHSAPAMIALQTPRVQEGLPQHEQELLTNYLEMTTLHPEDLEYHVRLASLYHRNNMQQDLFNELSLIEGIDPTHAILILADTTAFTFEMLEPLPGDSSMNINEVILFETETTADSAAADTTASDSLEMPADSTELITTVDSLIILPTDTIITVADTLLELLPDTLDEVIPETEPDTLLPPIEDEFEITPEESLPPVLEEAEEETVEPDTLVQP